MGDTAFLAKLQALIDLQGSDRDPLAMLKMSCARTQRRRIILNQHVQPEFVYVILSGWAARYEGRLNGTRRITGFLLPGDFCGIHAACHAVMDHAIVALSHCKVGRIDRQEFASLAHGSPQINEAVWRAKLMEEAILRKWLLLADDAQRAIAHLLCELYARAATVGLAANERCLVPLTQAELGDAMNITAVHTNRVLQRLKAAGVVELSQQELFIKDPVELQRIGQFDPTYLRPWRRDQARGEFRQVNCGY